MLDLVISTDLSKLPKAIEFNFDELKTAYAERLKKYDGLVVSQDAMADAKEIRAGVNRSVTALMNAKKEVKAKCLAPFKEFEAKVNELVGMGENVQSKIGEQIDAITKKRRDEKEHDVFTRTSEHFFNNGKGCCDWQYSMVRNDSWFNATFPIDKAVEEAIHEIERVNNEVALVEAKAPDVVRESAVRMYRQHGLAEAMKFIEDFINDKKKQEQRPAVEAKPSAPEVHEAVTEVDHAPELLTFSMKVVGTRSALIALKTFMNNNGITYSSIK